MLPSSEHKPTDGPGWDRREREKKNCVQNCRTLCFCCVQRTKTGLTLIDGYAYMTYRTPVCRTPAFFPSSLPATTIKCVIWIWWCEKYQSWNRKWYPKKVEILKRRVNYWNVRHVLFGICFPLSCIRNSIHGKERSWYFFSSVSLSGRMWEINHKLGNEKLRMGQSRSNLMQTFFLRRWLAIKR